MSNVGYATLSVLPSLQGFGTSLNKQLGGPVSAASDKAGKESGKRFSGAFGGAIKGIAVAAGGALAAVGISGFFKDAIGGASDLSETSSKVQQIFGAEGASIEKFAATANKALGQTRQQALDASATFGVFGKAAGLTGPNLTKFSTQMVGLSADMASFGNTSPEQAIDAIGAALRGESEPIRQYGVLLDDATLRQRALALGLIKTTKDALTPQQKALAAQAEILAQTADQQGDFARTSGGLANQQRILGAQWSDMKTTIGAGLLPVITRLAVFANEKLIPALKDAGSFIKTRVVPAVKDFGGEAKRVLGPAIKDIGEFLKNTALPALKDFGKFITGTVVPGMKDLAGWLKDNEAWLKPIAVGVLAAVAAYKLWTAATATWTAVTKLAAAAQRALNLVMKANVIGLIVLALVGLVAGLTYAWKNSETFRDVVTGVWEAVKSAVSAVVDWFTVTVPNAFKSVIDWVKKNWPLLLAIITGPFGLAVLAITKNWDSIKSGASSAVQWVKDKFNGIVSFFRELPGKISSATSGMFNGIANAFRSAVNWLIQKWNSLSFSLPSVDTHIPGVGRIGGWSLNTPNISPIPALAKGGNIIRPGLALVGDAGPELLHLPRGAAVQPLSGPNAPGGGVQKVEVYLDGQLVEPRMYKIMTEHDRAQKRSYTAMAGAY